VTISGFLLYVGSFDQTIISSQVAPTPHQLPDTVYSIPMFEVRTGWKWYSNRAWKHALVTEAIWVCGGCFLHILEIEISQTWFFGS
jgi:hypothetical protein